MSFFDEAFLAGPAAGPLARSLTPGGCPPAEELARAWVLQLGSADAARFARATPAAADFLRTFTQELQHRDEFRPLFDSRALADIEASTALSVETLRALRADLATALNNADQKYQLSLAHGLSMLIGDNCRQTNIYNVFGGASRSLTDNISTQQFHMLAGERTRTFVGRDFVFDTIDQLLLNPEFPWSQIVICVEPGIGEAALICELVKRPGYVHHFDIASSNIRSVRDFLTNTCAQLIVRYGLAHTTLPDDAAADSGVLKLLLAEAGASQGWPAVLSKLHRPPNSAPAAPSSDCLLPVWRSVWRSDPALSAS